MALQAPLRRRAPCDLRMSAKEPSAQLVALGDISLTRPPVWRAELIFGELLPVLAGADIRIGNLEGIITAHGLPAAAIGSRIRAAPAALDVLAEAGFDVVSMANNHSLDFGPQALAESLASLRSRGIDACGILAPGGEAQPATCIVRSVRVGFLAFCDDHAGVTLGPEDPRPCLYTPEAARAAIAAARRAVDVLVVQMHWGYEFSLHPLLRHRNEARRMVEAGASAVLCHHAHVPQGMEIWRGCPVVHGLGNAVMPMSPYMRAGHDWTNRSFAVELGLRADGVSHVSIHPFGIGQDGCVAPLPGHARRGLLGGLARMSRRLRDDEFLGRAECARMLYEAWQMVDALKDVSARGDEELRQRARTLALPRQQQLIEYLSRFTELAWLAAALREIAESAQHVAPVRSALRRVLPRAGDALLRARRRYRWRDALRSRIP